VKARYLAFILILALSLFFLVKPSLSIWSTPLLAFNATPNTVYLNWTSNYQTNVTITSNDTNSATNTSNITIEIYNTTSSLTWNYSQFNSYPSCLNSTNYLIVGNAITYGNVSGPINGSNITYNNVNFTLIYDLSTSIHPCSPGRYWLGNLTIGNYTNSTEQTYLSVILDIPISQNSSNNPLNNVTGLGSFGYSKMPANATQYQSYFFNATSSGDAYIRNATSVLINLTGWPSSQDVDLFLFDNSGNLKAKSINKNTNEEAVYGYLPSANQMWEIRVYGNSSNTSGITYYGQIVFNTLNMTNASDTSQRIDLLNFTSAFGTSMNVSNISTINLTLKNEGNINLTNVAESKYLYHVEKFVLSGNQNISIIVPNSTVASKLKVTLNWTGASNYSFDVYKSDGSLAMTSKNKHNSANMTGAMQEEYNETTSIGNGGYWRVNVKNNTNVTNDVYTLTALVYVNASEWISSNFTNFNFNTIELTNSTDTIQYNMTVPNDMLDGKYEGYIQFKDNAGSTLRVPVEVSTRTASLIVNNSFQSSTVTLNENINATLTKVLDITYNNTGSFPISISHTNSSGLLYLSNNNISFTYDAPSTIPANSSGTINITININTTNTSDTVGTYEGWIFLNANESLPSSNFNLTLRVNLSKTLTVTFLGVKTYADSNTTRNSSAESVLLGFDISYINGTGLDNPYAINATNITSWLNNINITTYNITLTDMTNYTSVSPIYSGGVDYGFGANHYYVNGTVPENSLGGTYDMGLTVNYSKGGNVFSGSGLGSTTGKYLIINNSGLYMTYTNVSSVTLPSNNITRSYVNITNYGPVDSNASLTTINFTASCSSYYTISGADSSISGPSGCTATYSSTANTYNVKIPANSTCILWWIITASNIDSDSTCSGSIQGDGLWFNPQGISYSVTVQSNTTTSSSTDTTTTTTTTNTPTTTNTESMSFTVYQPLVTVQQNSSNYTDVRIQNTGNLTLNASFSISGINSAWYTINDTSSRLLFRNSYAGYRIYFAVGNVEVGDYQGYYSFFTGDQRLNQSFTLRILPALAKQIEINDTLAQYKFNMTDLEIELNQSRDKNLNITLAEQKFAELKAAIAEADGYIASGDYFNANKLLESIKDLINQTKTELSNAKVIGKQESRKQIFIYTGIVVGVVVIAAVAYLFWPTRGSKKGLSLKSLNPAEKERDFEKLKDKYKKE
jgi:tetrahydromethanopterin S-methyltransferase subunit G